MRTLADPSISIGLGRPESLNPGIEQPSPSREQNLLPQLALDHLVLTAADPEATIRFYAGLFNGRPERTGGRLAISFGRFKINVHQAGAERQPCAQLPTPGAADICFVSRTPLAERLHRLQALGIPLELGPVLRPGACGLIESIYCRDPDGNLVEWGAPISK